MQPREKNSIVGITAKYSLLEEDDIIKEGDEYYNQFKNKWMPVMKEFINQKYNSEESKPVRRKFI